jgi:glycosyltransferase involved in cell wall biosynthesis
MNRPAATDVCLLTPGQPSNNPRLVKEADALTEAGYTVQVLCVDCGLWPSQTDSSVLAVRSWACKYVGGLVRSRPWMYRLTRWRQALGNRAMRWLSGPEMLRTAAMLRVGPELEAEALRHPAKLYIAHHVAALSAAVKAASKYGGSVGYDAEDFYTGMHTFGQPPALFERIAAEVERKYLRSCDYVTAASPAIADAYAEKYRIPPAVTVLNVFPLVQRPAALRSGSARGPLRLYWFSQGIGGDRGLEDVVRAMGLLGDANIELHLRGNWQAGYREQLYAVARSAGANTARIVSHVPAPPDDMIRLAAEYDVGLALELPLEHNRTLCLTNKLFVYLLAGNAIIATRVKAQQSLMAKLGGAGWCYEPGDIETLAAGIRNWYRDRQSLESSRRTAWDWGERRYNWDVEKQTFLSLVEGAVSPMCSDRRSDCVAS